MDFLTMNHAPEFLKAAMAASRARPLTVRQLSKKLGYNSDRSVGMVLKGRRSMSGEMQVRLTRLLHLTPKEQRHLQSLVRRERDKAPAVEPAPVPERTETTLSPDRLHPLVPAYSLVILEILRIHGGLLTAPQVRAKLRQKVELAAVQTTLEELARENLIKETENGYFRALAKNEFVGTSSDIPSIAIRAIHRGQLERAIETIEEQSISERELIAKTVTVPRARLPEIKRRIREMLDELSDQIEDGAPADESSIVAQMNIQFYLQSK